MTVGVGDTFVMTVKTKRLAPNQRIGVIEEILDPAQPRYVVRWADGRASVVAPLPGSYRIEAAKRARKRAAGKPAAGKSAARKPRPKR